MDSTPQMWGITHSLRSSVLEPPPLLWGKLSDNQFDAKAAGTPPRVGKERITFRLCSGTNPTYVGRNAFISSILEHPHLCGENGILLLPFEGTEHPHLCGEKLFLPQLDPTSQPHLCEEYRVLDIFLI